MSTTSIKKIKLVYITDNPFLARDLERFGVNKLEEKGVDVSVYDITSLISKKVLKNYRFLSLVTHPSIITCHSWKHFKTLLSQLSQKDTVVTLFNINTKTLKVFRILSKRSFILGHTRFGLVLTCPTKRSFSLFIRKLFLTNPLKIIEAIRYKAILKIPRSILGLKELDFIIVGGLGASEPTKIEGPRTKKIFAHSFDYNNYLITENHHLEPIIKEPYIAYIDQFLPFHPDFYYHDQPRIDPSEYYEELCQFFSKIEQKFKMPIIIISHPRSNYNEHTEDFFKGRKIIKDSTLNLIKFCQCVFAHYSTAINFAIIYKKPINFITLSCINKQPNIVNYITCFAQYFKQEPILISTLDLCAIKIKEDELDLESYKKYYDEFIKCPNTPNKLLDDFIFEQLS